MSPAVRAIFADYSPPIGITLAILLTAVLYLRGWLAIRRTRPAQFTAERLACFLSGLTLLWIAIASPLDGFADTLLTVHMVEHLLLMSAIPMLLLYALPVVPLLRGLPAPITRIVAGPLLRLRALRALAHWLVTPAIAWLAMNIAYLAWHVPAAYDLALENEGIHAAEHLCFLITSLLFWWVIFRPWPAEKRPNDWGILLYLALADIVMTMLSGFLTFCDRPVYPYYVAHPNPFGLPVLTDQVLGAVIMWVLGSFAYLIPAMVITVRLLSPVRDNVSMPVIDKDRSREIRAEIRRVLMSKWDPIGVADEPMAADEYDSYIGDVFELLKSNASSSRIGNYLREIETVRMGLIDAQGQPLVPADHRKEAVAALIQLRTSLY